MSDDLWVDKLAFEVRRLASSGVSDLESVVDEFLAGELHGAGLEERLRILELLAQQFGAPTPGMGSNAGVEKTDPTSSLDVTRLVSLVLGKNLSDDDINSREIYGKFSQALTTLFDTLNEIISVINITLLGQSPELETIRKVIGSNIDGDAAKVSLKEYLDRIQTAFLVAHSSFQAATATVIAEVLAELDPQPLSAAKSSGFKFGPLRKAELFEQYEEKYARCRKWFDSGAFKERLLREFEKNCQKTFNAPLR